jgi:hypothetical protein
LTGLRTMFMPSGRRSSWKRFQRLSLDWSNCMSRYGGVNCQNNAQVTHSVAINIQPGGASVSRPTTEWDPKVTSFIIKVPSAAPTSLGAIASGFENDFQNFFGSANKGQAANVAQVHDSHPAPSLPQAASGGPNRLPVLDMLQRPGELLRTTTPYMMTVEVKNNGLIAVQCSHQASLELMGAYFQKWGKKNAAGTQGYVRSLFSSVRLEAYP